MEYPKPEPRQKKQPRPLRQISEKRQKAIDAGLVQLKVRTPIKQSTTPIKQVSQKQAANLRAYEKGKAAKYEADNRLCESCERSDRGISCSHLVARSHSFDMVADTNNHLRQCFVCAGMVESGRFFQLQNGLKLLERLWSGLGEKGKERFRYVLQQWPQNQDLWQFSAMVDEPCDDENNFKEH